MLCDRRVTIGQDLRLRQQDPDGAGESAAGFYSSLSMLSLVIDNYYILRHIKNMEE